MPKESTPLHTGIIKIFSESSFYSSSSSPPSLSSQISPHTTSQEQDDVKFLCQPSSSKPLQSVSDSSTTPFHLEPDHRYASICNVFLPSCPQRKQTFQTSKTPQGLSSPSLPTMGRHKGESQGQEVELGGQGRQSPNSRRTLPLKFVFLRSYMLCRTADWKLLSLTCLTETISGQTLRSRHAKIPKILNRTILSN